MEKQILYKAFRELERLLDELHKTFKRIKI
jgi:hypothetical protein